MNTYRVDVAVVENAVELDVGVSGASIVEDMELATPIQVVQGEHYTGAVAVTPTASTQTLHTAGLFVDEDITIAPIPSNYGLITWDGSVLTVS